MARRARLNLMVCLLAVVTAVALLSASALIAVRAVDTRPVADARTAVVAFYDAANTVLRTGDPAALDAVVAPDFVARAPVPGVPPDRAGLARYLAAVHAAFPDARLVVEDLVAAGEWVMARATVRGTAGGRFVGIPLGHEPRVSRSLDAFRIAGDRVVELWGSADGLALLEQLARTPLATPLPASQAVALERLTYPAGWHREAEVASELRVIYVEAGSLTVSIDGRSPGPALLAPVAAAGAEGRPTAVAPGTEAVLSAGDFLALPPRTSHAVRNDGGTPTQALAQTGAGLAVPWDGALQARPDGLIVRPLAGGRTTPLPAGPAGVALGRATLEPGAAFSTHALAGPALLAVEAGSVGLEVDNGVAWVTRGSPRSSGDVEAGWLAAGDGALLRPGTAVAVRNVGDEPLVILVLAIAPATEAVAP